MSATKLTVYESDVRSRYRELREKDYPASQAWSMAQTFAAWEALEAQGLVRLTAEPDPLPYDDSYLDTWGLTPKKLDRARKELWKFLEREGVWVYTTETWDGHEWQHADSIGGVDGEIWDAYKEDLMREAISQVVAREALKTSA